MSDAEYPGYKKWSFKRWAWEFLRRNRDYIAACKRIGDDEAQKAAIATQFGLKRFKPYREPHIGASGRPLFLGAAVSFLSNVEVAADRRMKVTLRDGEVLIRFNLSATINDPDSIDAQLRSAAVVIRKHQKAYLARLGRSEPKGTRAKQMWFLRSLKLLDLLDGKVAAHREPGRALRLVNEPRNAPDPKSDAEARESGKKQIEQARRLTTSGYLHLATREGKPNIA